MIYETQEEKLPVDPMQDGLVCRKPVSEGWEYRPSMPRTAEYAEGREDGED